MRKLLPIFLVVLFAYNSNEQNSRFIINLDKDWKFINSDITNGEQPYLKTTNWETVTIPHDWAISGEFDENNDVYYISERGI